MYVIVLYVWVAFHGGIKIAEVELAQQYSGIEACEASRDLVTPFAATAAMMQLTSQLGEIPMDYADGTCVLASYVGA